MDDRDTKTKRASHDPPERGTEDKKATKLRPKKDLESLSERTRTKGKN